MKKLNILSIIIAISFVFLLASCGSEQKKAYEETRTPVKVTVAQANVQNTAQSFKISGKIASDNEVDLSAKVMGYIEWLDLEVGDKISKGGLVARIKNQEVNQKVDQANSMIEQAEISLKAIEKDYSRIKRLFDQKSATQKELDDITTMMESAKAKIRQLESSKNEAGIMSAYSEVRSPISGVVTRKFKQQGEMASPGIPILSIEDQKDKIIEIKIPENYISSVNEGTSVRYKLESDDSWSEGTITELATSTQSGQFAAKIGLKGHPEYFSGMYADVMVFTDKEENAAALDIPVSVDNQALVKRGQLTGIFVPTTANTAVLRWVVTGRTMGDKTEILSGLDRDENYITGANSRLINGMPIEY